MVPWQRMLVRLEAVGNLCSHNTDDAPFLMGRMIELCDPEGGIIQCVEMEAMILSEEEEDSASEDSGWQSHGGWRLGRESSSGMLKRRVEKRKIGEKQNLEDLHKHRRKIKEKLSSSVSMKSSDILEDNFSVDLDKSKNKCNK